MRLCCRSRAARRISRSMRSFLTFGRMPVHPSTTPYSAAPMALGALAVPGPPHASIPHVQDPSKSDASPGYTGKAGASQAVLSYADVGQEGAWRQIVFVVDILSVGVSHASI